MLLLGSYRGNTILTPHCLCKSDIVSGVSGEFRKKSDMCWMKLRVALGRARWRTAIRVIESLVEAEKDSGDAWRA